MKTMPLIITIVSLGVLKLEPGFAADTGAQSAGTQAGSTAPAASSPRGGQAVVGNGAAQTGPANSGSESLPPAAMPQPGLGFAAPVAKRGLPATKLDGSKMATGKLPVSSRPLVPISGALGSRNASTKSLGGLSSASAKSSLVVINGTVMKRKF